MNLFQYSGAGNTFILADNREGFFDVRQVPLVCQQYEVDGLIFVETAQDADAFMRIYNRDGSEAEMCGNGLRCFIHFLKELGIERTVYEVETKAGRQRGWFSHEEICVQLSSPTHLSTHVTPNCHFINTGVPHAVLFVGELEKIDVALEGKKIRHSPLFAPAGANVNFVTQRGNGTLAIRTYERGVESETLACGTGATAAALVAHKLYDLPSPIDVYVRSGESLKNFL